MQDPFRVVIRSDMNYERLIAEITFLDTKIGLILSQENSVKRVEISVFSLIKDSDRLFYDTEKVDQVTLSADIFTNAIRIGMERLKLLDESK